MRNTDTPTGIERYQLDGSVRKLGVVSMRENKNRTPFRSLDVINADERIDEVYFDTDGIWIEVCAGWTCDPLSAHGGHANTVVEALRIIRGITRCAETCGCRIIPQPKNV